MSTATYEGDVYEDGQQYKDDKNLMVKFEMRAIKHEFRSTQEGRPVFVDIPYVSIIVPGSRDILVAEATEHYQQRFAQQWQNFLAREKQAESGTPLAEVPWLTKSQVAEMNAINIKTVEHLVNLPDTVAMKVMGYHELKRRAQRFLDAAAGEAPMLKMEAELKQRDSKIESMEQTMADMKAQLDAFTKAQKQPVKA